MGLGLRGRIKEAQQWLLKSQLTSDVAVRFDAYEKDKSGKPTTIGLSTPVYGGAYDVLTGCHIGPASQPLILPCSMEQYKLITCESPRIESNGGRGSGKSDGGLLKVIRSICDRPGEHGEISGPTYRILRIDWFKLLSMLPRSWLKPGREGIRLSERELHFITGTIIRFASADNPDALRSWGGSYAFCDEEQDVSCEALDVIFPSLRLTDRPQLWTSGTPKPGMYFDRHERNMQNPESECFRFESFANPFISHKVFELARRQMDERTYRQEILAEWIPLSDDANLVFYCFDRAKHGSANGSTSQFGRDITRRITLKRCGIARPNIIGVDYNWDFPNYAVVWHVFEPNVWVAVDVVSAKGHAGHLAVELKKRGYSDSLIIDDASGRYNHGPKSSTRLLRAEGFKVFHPNKNPLVTDRIDATLSKLAPVEGSPSIFVVSPQCDELMEAFESLQWSKTAGKLDKSIGVDHVIDAATYPIAFFCPVGKMPKTFTGLLAA